MPKKANKTLRMRAVRMYARGDRLNLIEEKTGFNRVTIRNWARKEGLPPRSITYAQAANRAPHLAKYKKAIKLRQQGVSLKRTAQIVGIEASSVSTATRNAPGVKVHRRNRDPEIKKKVVEAYRNGDSLILIVKTYGVAFSSIRLWARDAGIPPRDNSLPQETRERVAEAYLNGATYSEIEDQYGVSAPRIIKTFDIKKRNRTYSEATKRKAVNAWKRCGSRTKVSKQMGIPVATIGSWTKKAQDANAAKRERHLAKYKKAIKLRQQGVSLKRTAQIVGIDASSVSAATRNAPGVKAYRRNRDPEVKKKVVEAYRNGDSLPLIAKTFSVAISSVRLWAREAGIPPRDTSISQKTREQVAEEYLNGATYSELKEKYGVSVAHIIQSFDIQKRKRTYSEATKRKAVNAWKRGGSLAEVSKQMGIPATTIGSWTRTAKAS